MFTLVPYVLACISRSHGDSQEILLMFRSNTGFRDNHYALIGGKIEDGETPHIAIIRELQEEVGITVDPKDAHLKHVRYFMGETRPCVCFVFVITNWAGEPFNLEADKHDHITWFSLEKLPKDMIPRHEGIIHDIESGIFYADEGFLVPPK